MKHRIPQLDGLNDSFVKGDVSRQTNDSLSIILNEEIGENCEDEYIGETFWSLPAGFYYDNWYTDSVRRAPQGCRVNRLGEIKNITTGNIHGKVS